MWSEYICKSDGINFTSNRGLQSYWSFLLSPCVVLQTLQSKYPELFLLSCWEVTCISKQTRVMNTNFTCIHSQPAIFCKN